MMRAVAKDASWRPGSLPPDRPTYVALADAIAHDIARRALGPGDRLPTHRALADELGVTVRTVARGYAEAERRGLVGGEVGRGTYVRTGFGLGSGEEDLVDLAALHPPIAPGLVPAERLAATLRAIAADPLALRAVTDTEHGSDHPAHRAAAAAWVARDGFAPHPEDMLLTNGAQHAITLCLLALTGEGTAVATTALTNPGLLAAARTLSVPLAVVEHDQAGMLPESLAEICARERIGVVHLQPTLDNPSGLTMPQARREQLAAVAEQEGLWLIEDDPLGPLSPGAPAPVAALLPERTCHVASAAKVLALGLRVGLLTAPPAAYPRLVAALRSSTWLSAPLLGEVLTRWVGDGTAERIVAQRVAASRGRNALAREALAGLEVTGHADAPHLWLELPAPWSPGSFVAAARTAGILVAPGDDYAAQRGRPGLGVRIGLNADVPDTDLRTALGTLRHLVELGPSAT